VKFAPGMADGTLPFTIGRADLGTKKGAGKVLWDAERGRLHTSEVAIEMQGELESLIGGMTTNVVLQQTQKATTRWVEKER